MSFPPETGKDNRGTFCGSGRKKQMIIFLVSMKNTVCRVVFRRVLLTQLSHFFRLGRHSGGLCYDTALYEVESPVISWVQALGTYL